MTGADVAGLAGVVVMLLAYAGAALGWDDPKRPLSLLCNLFGAGGVLWSLLTDHFNLSATVMEASWALVALAGLVRWVMQRRPPARAS